MVRTSSCGLPPGRTPHRSGKAPSQGVRPFAVPHGGGGAPHEDRSRCPTAITATTAEHSGSCVPRTAPRQRTPAAPRVRSPGSVGARRSARTSRSNRQTPPCAPPPCWSCAHNADTGPAPWHLPCSALSPQCVCVCVCVFATARDCHKVRRAATGGGGGGNTHFGQGRKLEKMCRLDILASLQMQFSGTPFAAKISQNWWNSPLFYDVLNATEGGGGRGQAAKPCPKGCGPLPLPRGRASLPAPGFSARVLVRPQRGLRVAGFWRSGSDSPRTFGDHVRGCGGDEPGGGGGPVPGVRGKAETQLTDFDRPSDERISCGGHLQPHSGPWTPPPPSPPSVLPA